MLEWNESIKTIFDILAQTTIFLKFLSETRKKV